MRLELVRWSTCIRGLALAGICLLGLVAIVGSGGGAPGFPPCEPPICPDGPPPPPLPSASVEPAYITALVGTGVTFTAQTSNLSGSLSYQWRRSSDGGITFNDIAGATGRTYSLPSVNLGDDGARFKATVTGGNGVVRSLVGQLAVSATPGIVIEDKEFLPADWIVSPVADPGQLPFVHSDERVTTGGNPGAYRKMVFQLPQGAGAARLFYASLSATYDPALQGGVYVIDYAEDCIVLQPSASSSVLSSLVIEQGGRRYLTNTNSDCVLDRWNPQPSRASLGVSDFRLFDGPACNAGESCPDFSASAPPMRFGYWRLAFGVPGDVIGHGIDNWKVTVWRR